MEDRKRLLAVAGGGTLMALGLGTLLYFQSKGIDEMRTEIEQVNSKLASDRKTLERTPDLEQDIIVHRETDQVVKTLLPNDQDILNFVRTLRDFEEASGVQFSSIKDNSSRARANKNDFEKVTYSVNFESDAFQMLSFLDLVESHERFMRTPAFKLKSAPRRDFGDISSDVRHSIEMEVETYVYEPTAAVEQIKIDGYDAKRNLLRTRIASRQRELTVLDYEYRGPRNRRDPWVDPRVPANSTGPDQIPIEDQIALVEDLIDRTRAASSLLDGWRDADNLIAEMKSRGELETILAGLDEEVRRVQAEARIQFLPAERRFQQEVVDELDRIRRLLDTDDGVQLPVVMLRQAIETMYGHLEYQEYDLALESYKGLSSRLDMTADDPVRGPLVQRLRDYARLAETVISFESTDLVIGGIVDLGPDRRAVLIEGRPYLPGELVNHELMVRSITPNSVNFIYKDVEINRPIAP